jgi:hypothetical protein
MLVSDLDSTVVGLKQTCKDGPMVRVLPCGAREFTAHCFSGQLSLDVPVCDGWDAGFETRVATIASREGFRYAIELPEIGCTTFSIFTNDVDDGIGKRAIRIVTELLGLNADQPAWYEHETYGRTRPTPR